MVPDHQELPTLAELDPRRLLVNSYDVAVLAVLDTEITGFINAFEAFYDIGVTSETMVKQENIDVAMNALTTPGGKKLLLVGPLPDQGQEEARAMVEKILRNFTVGTMALIGISGGLDSSVKIFDTVVATMADQYDKREDTKDDEVTFSGKWHPGTDQDLVSKAKLPVYHPARKTWTEHAEKIKNATNIAACPGCEDTANVSPTIHVGYVASGNTVNKSKKLRDKLLKERSRHLLCQDTESIGFSTAITNERSRKKSPFVGSAIIIRGISDLCANKEASKDITCTAANLPERPSNLKIEHGQTSQVLGTWNAATLLFALLEHQCLGTFTTDPVRRYEELRKERDTAKNNFEAYRQFMIAKMQAQLNLAQAEADAADPVSGVVLFDGKPSAGGSALRLRETLSQPRATAKQYREAVAECAKATKYTRLRKSIEDHVENALGQATQKVALTLEPASKMLKLLRSANYVAPESATVEQLFIQQLFQAAKDNGNPELIATLLQAKKTASIGEPPAKKKMRPSNGDDI